MVLLGDKAQVEARTYNRLRTHFGCTRWNSYVMWVMWNLILVHLETVLVSVLDRCRVCTKHTMAQKLFWTQPMVHLHLSDEAQVEA
jgi:hypothetical protein